MFKNFPLVLFFLLTLLFYLLAYAEKSHSADLANSTNWHGFNLLEMFYAKSDKQNRPFLEDDFKELSQLGFTFVRLPIDCFCYVKSETDTNFNEEVLKRIDQAVAWGKKYGIHVNVALHTAPGYSVRKNYASRNLWTKKEVQDAFVAHWEMFARRYKNESQGAVSFNLVNEPNTDKATYIAVFSRVVKAVHKISPERLVVVDANHWGKESYPEIYKLPNVIVAIRGYTPFLLTHYKASWVNTPASTPVPSWPLDGPTLTGYLYSPGKKEVERGPCVLRRDFPKGTKIAIRVNVVSSNSTLQIRADDKPIYTKEFKPGPGKGEWKKVGKWGKNTYQNEYDKDYSVTLAQAAKEVAFETIAGDWISYSKMMITLPSGQTLKLGSNNSWGAKQAICDLTPAGLKNFDAEKPLTNYLAPWRAAMKDGATVFVGEMGAFRHTPHDVTLRWMESSLRQYKQMGIGWAVWNYRGSFGPLDSDRSDVKYLDWKGKKCDEKMMRLLRKYL